MVSHDRAFLNAVTQETVELKDRQLRCGRVGGALRLQPAFCVPRPSRRRAVHCCMLAAALCACLHVRAAVTAARSYFAGPFDAYAEAKAAAALCSSRQQSALDKQRKHIEASIQAAERQARQVRAPCCLALPCQRPPLRALPITPA